MLEGWCDHGLMTCWPTLHCISPMKLMMARFLSGNICYSAAVFLVWQEHNSPDHHALLQASLQTLWLARNRLRSLEGLSWAAQLRMLFVQVKCTTSDESTAPASGIQMPGCRCQKIPSKYIGKHSMLMEMLHSEPAPAKAKLLGDTILRFK